MAMVDVAYAMRMRCGDGRCEHGGGGERFQSRFHVEVIVVEARITAESSPHTAIDEANPVRSNNDLANCSDKS
ncbi:hypothetical protein [Burkholderia sp. NLJ2]|uniref:hypothetical protein n=1 Tax=Burkholderia sp. NLJ2 TaxID=3090699 RepID=UPI003C6CC4DA